VLSVFIMPGLIVELTLGGFLTVLAIVGIVGAAAGSFFYSFRSQKATVKADAVHEWSEVASALEKKIGLAEEEIASLKMKDAQCQMKVNNITAFNLRLQAREVRYQRRINVLERMAGVDVTDFNDVTDAPEDSAFR